MKNRTRKYPAPTLRDQDNNIIVVVEAKLQSWTEYVEEFFNDNRSNTLPKID